MKNNIDLFLGKEVSFKKGNKKLIGVVFDCSTTNSTLWVEANNDTFGINTNDVELVKTNNNEELNKALNILTEKTNLNKNVLIDSIEIMTKKEFSSTFGYSNIAGFYIYKKVFLIKDIFDFETVIHEIGHYIHQKYLKDKHIRFDTKGKSHYANKNYLENFAECFVQWVLNPNDLTQSYKRVQQMDKILKEINIAL